MRPRFKCLTQYPKPTGAQKSKEFVSNNNIILTLKLPLPKVTQNILT